MENTVKRKMLFVECESCGFIVEFKYNNETFFFCKEHGFGVNIPTEKLETRQICGPCSRDVARQGLAEMKRYDLYDEDNLCPICEKNILNLCYNFLKN